ncbi:MAG: spore maturation protein [Bacilli bacterium]|nr:spore maturation protein [Bacilli bacterium]
MSRFFIPLIVLFVILYGSIKKINVYDSFINGANEGIHMVRNMFPSLLAMIFAVNIFSNSGVLDLFFSFLKPLLLFLKIPFEIIPVAVLRPLSGSFGLGLLNDIYKVYGPDSHVGILSSVIQGSSDTTLYIISLYFGTIGIRKIRYALWVGLLADLFMVLISLILVPFLT